MADTGSVTSHYDQDDLAAKLVQQLIMAGHNLDALGMESLSLVDQMHVMGMAATLDLHEALGISETDKVLDVGSGVGGPARTLAWKRHCTVIGLDLTPAFCEAARELTEMVELQGHVSFQEGSALDMPFDDASFDVVATQHATMNIPDKPTLYREIARVLKPGGRFGFWDVMKGPGGDLHFPVPWAGTPEISHLIPPDAVAEHLTAAGMERVSLEDRSETAKAWMAEQRSAREARAAAGEEEPPSGGPVLMGPTAPEKSKNIFRNLMEDRIALIQGVFRKPS